MGSTCSRTQITASKIRQVQVPADIPEKLFLEIGDTPSFISDLLSVEVLRGPRSPHKLQGKEPVPWEGDCVIQGVGMKFKEKRLLRGKEVALQKTITDIQDCPFSITMVLDSLEGVHKEATETMTYTVLPIDKRSCHIVVSFGYLSGGCCGRIASALCKPCFHSEWSHHVAAEIDCYYEEAMRKGAAYLDDATK